MHLHSVRGKDAPPARVALHQPGLPELRRAHDPSLARANRLLTHILTEREKSFRLRGQCWPEGSWNCYILIQEGI